MNKQKRIVFCNLCVWTSVSSGQKSKRFGRSENANEVLSGKLYNHIEEEHLHIVMEVWMNNQASRCIVKFEEKDIKCQACRNILALCDCTFPIIKELNSKSSTKVNKRR